MTKGILVASFGTSYPQTRQKTIEACEKAIAKAFPEYKIYRAFTSKVVIKQIQKQENITIFTVEQALEQMAQDGISEVYIQPLHIILGGEYEKVVTQANMKKDLFKTLKIAKPLLSSKEDYDAVCHILKREYGQFPATDISVLMGHGSQHYAFTAYAALDHMLQDSPVYIAAVESYPDVADIEKRIDIKKVKTIHLAPFMLVAGDHATNDMASDEEDSWFTYFKEKGFNVVTHLVGLGEFIDIQKLYCEHLAKIINA